MEESIINVYFYNNVSTTEMFPVNNYRTYFTNDWFKEDYVQFVLQSVDKCIWLENDVVRSPVLGIVPLERLSGAFMTLTLAYHLRDCKFPLRNLGGNCKEAIYRGALDSYTSWNFTGYMPDLLPEQKCYFPELDTYVTGDKVHQWLIYDTPDEFNPVVRRRKRAEYLDAIDIQKGRQPI